MLVVFVLRQVAHLNKEEFGTNIDPQPLCYAHANNIISILWTYRTLYTIRYECWAAQPCSLVAFSTIFNLESDIIIYDSFEKVCKILYEISEVYPLALDFLFGIRVTVQQKGVKVSEIARKYLSMADSPQQLELTKEWRALILLGKTEDVRGGNADITLGSFIKGFAGLAAAEE
ncbi:MAG: hypothetical protein GOMPHAMPRED_007061 [Gomphillus americanus]|uniref:Uncharacterized protein n=1 Tax=Gomphillus americanus TaxID=1940652 RepID=A0A8H3IBT4_9LECA|nr:MAG: hypothetical protein GOMPHAMPRED_007061 [Gomphillus americanus]